MATLMSSFEAIQKLDIYDDSATDLESEVEDVKGHHETQKNAFQRWFTENAAQIDVADVDETWEESSEEEKDSLRTLNEILEKGYQQAETSVREYQLELFERAKRQNTIAVLDTGTGKTLIAALLIDHILQQELVDRESRNSPRVAFFVVEKVALVVQQFYYLKSNLDHSIAYAHGYIQDNLWTQEFWTEIRQHNRLIVCTADVLLQSLMHSFVHMKAINLLVFDEVHHAKDSHPFAQIMREFYDPHRFEDIKPRIFSMTASPVESTTRGDLEFNIRALESMMDSKVATIVEEGGLRNFVPRPMERNVHYLPSGPTQDTELYASLACSLSTSNTSRKLLSDATTIKRELGTWCSDAYWTFALSDRIINQIEYKHSHSLGSGKKHQKSPNVVENEVQNLQAAKKIVDVSEARSNIPSRDQLSNKVETLKNVLDELFQSRVGMRCLVFVERRNMARLLHLLFSRIGAPGLRPGCLTGCRSHTESGFNATFRSQLLTIKDFREGRINCLFSTSVAEEGLDIPECSYVIRFDPCLSAIKYIQSLGRARSPNSKVVHFIAENSEDRERLEHIRQSVQSMKLCCANLPQDRLLGDHGEDPIEHNSHTQREETKVLDSGAKLTYAFAVPTLAYFCAHLPKGEGEWDSSPTYVQRMEGSKFRCEVILPSRSPLSSAIGRTQSRKSTAKQAAAYRACMILLRDNHLSNQLLPTYTKLLPALRNAKLALTSKRTSRYVTKLKPDIWSYSRGQSVNCLNLTILDLSNDWEKPTKPMALLTRHRLPRLPPFPLFKKNGETSSVNIHGIEKVCGISEDELELCTDFTLRVFQDVFNKTFEKNSRGMSWWVVPIVSYNSLEEVQTASPARLIDWELLREATLYKPFGWTPTIDDHILLNKYLINPNSGALRFFTIQIVRGVSPFDNVPGKPNGKKAHESIINWSSGLFKNSAQRRFWNTNQPVLSAEKISHRMDFFSPATEDQNLDSGDCLICPEPLLVSRLPPNLVNMCLLIPSIIHLLEAFLLALEFADAVELQIKPQYALEAVTRDPRNDTTSGDIEKSFRRDIGPNYERLEFLGDCFLKMATSLATFIHDKDENEFSMHCSRMAMLCNKNLFENSIKNEHFKYIRAPSFQRRSWYPEGLQLLAGKGARDWQKYPENAQQLSDKTIADVSEAMIGAALISNYDANAWSFKTFDNAVKAVTTFASNSTYVQHNNFHAWADYQAAYVEPKYQLLKGNAIWTELVRQLDEEAGYRFKSPGLAQCAFSHPSRPQTWSGVPSYQRLEFLGDALLDMVAVLFLFVQFPNVDEQWLTEHKMAIVSNKFLGALCVKLGFHRHLKHSQQMLETQIHSFAMAIEEAEQASGGCRSYWMTVHDPPKCLADIVEAYIAARFIDSNFDYQEVQMFFNDHIKFFFGDIKLYDSFAEDHPLTQYFKLMDQTFNCIQHRLCSEEIVAADRKAKKVVAATMIHGKAIAVGKARSTREAKTRAADQALRLLHGLSVSEFRQKYDCNCGKDRESC